MDVLADGIGRGAFKGYADVSFVADYDLNSGWWKITYSATNESDGIVVSDELLYEAPHKGYEKKVVVNGPPWPKFIFLKSRIPAIFSRIALDYYVWDGAPTNRVLSIYYKSWTNPYGDRSLEHFKIAEQNWQVEKELEAEARAAIKANKHPRKPDISQRIKAMNDKLEKDKARQEKTSQI